MNRQERRRQAKAAGHGAAQLQAGFARHQAGDLAGAEAAYRQVLRASPNDPEALRLLGEALVDSGRPAEAITLLQRLAGLKPDHFITHYTLGNAYRAAAREAEAAAAFRLALTHQPGFAPAWADLGTMLAITGDLAGAEAALQRAASLAPTAAALRHLATIRPGSMAATEAAALQARAADPRTPDAEKIDLLFALGRDADKAERFDDAFGCFARANHLLCAAQAKSGRGYNPARMARDVDQIIAAFTPDVFETYRAGGNPSDAPVFILGMPRAGSTLFEQIAASHPDVFGAGEQKAIGDVARQTGWRPSPAWSAENLRAGAAAYLAQLTAMAGGAARIIDKLPDNIFQLGLIATLFPNARVIFCARDARDTCLSCFFQHFSEPYGFDTDLADCAHRYVQTERLAQHWRAVLPLRHITMSYEALLTDFEGESRRLIDFLGLAWDPVCLAFHETARPVRTASWSQVRRPLYQTAAGRWHHYERHLAPLINAL